MDFRKIFIYVDLSFKSYINVLFNEQINLIEQNLAAQDNILTALTDVYARSADSRKLVDEVLKRREGMINSLISSYDAYEDLLAKSFKGLEFYRKLETNVSKLLQRVKSTCKVQEEEREQILARNNKPNNIPKATEFVGPGATQDEPISTGGGLKLKDYLANRQKGVSTPSYQNPYYNQHVVQSGSPQPLPAVRPAPVGQEGNDAGSSLAPDTSDSNRNYPYSAGYADYYTAQRGVSELPQAYGQYMDYPGGGLNCSLPRSGTTNTGSTYHQANGSTDTTEVTSFNGQYLNYEQSQYPHNVQGQYPAASTQLQYNPNSYANYPGYSSYPEQNYTPQNPAASSQESQPPHSTVENSNIPTAGIKPQNQQPYMLPNKSAYSESQHNLGLGMRQDQQIAPQTSITPQHQLSQSQQIAGQIRQYESQNSQLQQSLQQIPQHSLQASTANNQIPTHSDQPYGVNQQIPSHYQISSLAMQQPISQPQQIPSQNHQPQSVSREAPLPQSHEVPQIPANDIPAAIPAQMQYPQSQYSGSVAISSGLQYGTYPGSSSYVSSPYPPGVHQNQQGYSNSTTSQQQQIQSQLLSHQGQSTYQEGKQIQQNEANAPGTVQGQNTQVTQSYPDGQQNYGSYQNPYAYQTQNPQNSTVPQSYGVGSYSTHSEMIQSHAKPVQNYQYSLQGQYAVATQYQGFVQGYQNTYSGSQVPSDSSLTSQIDSYKGHPGYIYDPNTGLYQYSSGYQNSQTATPDPNSVGVPVSVVQQNQAYSNYAPQDNNTQYTIANNNTATNHTPSSQYNQQTYQTPNYNQAYYTLPYGHQGQSK